MRKTKNNQKTNKHGFILENCISSRCNSPLRLFSEPLTTLLARFWIWKIILWIWLLSASENFTRLLSCLEIYWLSYAEDTGVSPQWGASHGTDWRWNKRPSRQPTALPMGFSGLLGRGAHTEGGITRVVCNPSHSLKKPSGFSRQLFHRVKLGAIETAAARSCAADILLT